MNNKGFTLIEVLIVVVLLALLFSLGVPGVMKISSMIKVKTLETKVELVKASCDFSGRNVTFKTGYPES